MLNMLPKNFENLVCWQNARKLTKMIHELSRDRKLKDEIVLREMMLDSGIDLMSNISSGFGRYKVEEFQESLEAARGIAFRIKSMHYLMVDAELISQARSNTLKNQIRELTLNLTGLINFIDTKEEAPYIEE